MVFLTKQMGVPTVVHYRFGRIPSLIESKNWEWKLIRLTMRAASCVLLLDTRSASEVRREVPEIRVELIPNPIDPKKVEDAGAKEAFVDTIAGFSRIVFVGHIVPRKGIRDLVRACLLLPEGSFQLDLVGFAKHDFQLELTSLAQARSHGNWLTFHGELDRPHVVRHLREADIVAFPSHTEGFPNAVLEAMVLGKPIVATNVGAIPEMLGENTNEPCGLLVQPGRAKELMQALVTLMTDKERARVLGERARRKALASYTISKIVEDYICAWKSVSLGR
jgi:glycosyltransferase involved in cell wall biosynthesis